MTMRVATDVGGTFTDLAAYDVASNEIIISKVSTTLDIRKGVADAIEKAQLKLAGLDYFIHGSTVAINTVIERKGASTALLTTEGFRDTLEIARGNIINSFDLMFRTPEPLVPRRHRLEIFERMLADGSILRKIDVRQAKEAIDALTEQGIEAIAVCLLHAYANPEHEQALKDLIAKHCGNSVFATISSDILREYREFERASTTVLNAYIGPRVSNYLSGIKGYLAAGGFKGNAMIMQSSGGTMTMDFARSQPVRTMESGPVGGTVAAAHVAAKSGYKNVVAFDMGGTTAKISIVRNGELDIAEGYWIGGEEHGYPLQLPVVDVVEIGAGGGSIAHVDDVGSLKIGPQSAGAVPGPAAYGQGGDLPTVTDANVAMGRLNPAFFLGGEIGLSVEKAKAAIEEHVAKPLGLEVIRAAAGIVKIADTYMAHAVRQMTVQKGHDPRDFVVVGYGGGGPGHAVSIAQELGIRTVVIPVYPGILSAVGMLLTDAKEEFVQSRLCKIADIDSKAFEDLFKDMEQEGAERMREAGFHDEAITIMRSVEMRYTGQEFTLRIPLDTKTSFEETLPALKERFAKLHEVRYGHAFDHAPLEIVSLHTEVRGHLPKPKICGVFRKEVSAMPTKRSVYFDETGFVECDVYAREGLIPETKFSGPAIIEEMASTTVIPSNCGVHIDEEGNIIISLLN